MPIVTVLLATFNGAAFLDAQLASLASQTIPNMDVLVSDDGSTDGTLAILAQWQSRWTKGRFAIIDGPHKGFAENFRALATRLDSPFDFLAFCDQDDVWDDDKLEVAIKVLGAGAPDGSGVYFSRTRLTDINGVAYRQSPLFQRPPSFRNAIVQSIGGGNTCVFNRAGAELYIESCRRTGFITHDWWGYLIVSGAGGHVHYDPVPHIGYRQHGGNAIGNNVKVGARFKRLGMLLQGRFGVWLQRNLSGLDACADLLTPEARRTMDEIAALRRKRFFPAVIALRRSKIYRQTRTGDLSLAIAAFIGKL